MSIAAREQVVTAAPESGFAEAFRRTGLSEPIPLLSQAECDALAHYIDSSDLPVPHAWRKGRAITDRTIYEIATKPHLIALLRSLLGEEIVLWGADIIRRQPGGLHPWHTDMESAAPDSRVVTAWIGIRNASGESGLRVIAGSHRFGRSVQEVLAGLQEDRELIADERMVEIARAIDPAVTLLRPDVHDGQAMLFDGRVWHSGRNEGSDATRIALLLQYASADTPISKPAGRGHEWPMKFAAAQVPVILVSGTGQRAANRLVPPPPPSLNGIPMIRTVARSVALPLAEDPARHRRAYHQFHGPTSTLAGMSCHISVLSSGRHPHPPHIHQEEELLIVLDGEVEVELAEDRQGTDSRRCPMRPGMLSYYPATQHHTIHNVGDRPATYLMFKWHAGIAENDAPLPASIFEYDLDPPPNPKPMATRLLFQQATHSLGKLHAHLTVLQPGAGYEPHTDPYDVAIVLLSGEVETIGERVKPLGLIYYSAGELHGMRNVGTKAATYLVFEFHSPAAIVLRSQQAQIRHRRRAERQAERQRRELEKQRRKRGLRGLIRKIVKAVRKPWRE